MIDPHGWHLSAEHLICPARAPSAAGQPGDWGKTGLPQQLLTIINIPPRSGWKRNMATRSRAWLSLTRRQASPTSMHLDC
jgi:hypothetical protein